MSNKIQSFNAPDLSLQDLSESLVNWLSAQNFNSQMLKTENGVTLIQVEKQGGWRKAIGMSTALNVSLCQNGDELTVEIGAGRWIDKAAVGTVSLLILWPLAVTAAIGAWDQMKMPDKIFQFVRDHVGQSKLGNAHSGTRILESKNVVTNTISELQKLSEFRDKGILTEEEFKAQKDKLLNQ